MKFRIQDYDENCAMHCKNREEAEMFCEFLDSFGYSWADKTPYTSRLNWRSDGGGVCYRFHKGWCATLEYYKANYDMLILEFSDFDWNDEPILDENAMSFDELMCL